MNYRDWCSSIVYPQDKVLAGMQVPAGNKVKIKTSGVHSKFSLQAKINKTTTPPPRLKKMKDSTSQHPQNKIPRSLTVTWVFRNPVKDLQNGKGKMYRKQIGKGGGLIKWHNFF